MLTNFRIDSISVCAANTAHTEITIAELKAKKNVLCEKPVANTYKECEVMVKATKENGKYLMIDQNQCLAKAHIEAIKMIDAGAIGEILTK